MGSHFFIPLAEKIHDKIEHTFGGTTALQCVLKTENGSNHLIVSTIADTEVAVMREIDGELHMLFLSPKENWADPTAERRFKEVYADDQQLLKYRLHCPLNCAVFLSLKG